MERLLDNSPRTSAEVNGKTFTMTEMARVHRWFLAQPMRNHIPGFYEVDETTIVVGDIFFEVLDSIRGQRSENEGAVSDPSGLNDSIFVQGKVEFGDDGEFIITSERVPTSKVVITDRNGNAEVLKDPTFRVEGNASEPQTSQ